VGSIGPQPLLAVEPGHHPGHQQGQGHFLFIDQERFQQAGLGARFGQGNRFGRADVLGGETEPEATTARKVPFTREQGLPTTGIGPCSKPSSTAAPP